MALLIYSFLLNMDFRAFVEKYGESTTRAALSLAVARIRRIVKDKVAMAAATDGILIVSIDELKCDVASVIHVLNEFPFSVEEKSVLIAKAWEIVTP